MAYTHGHIIPLVGGSVIGTSVALGSNPEWIASWGSVFGANDKYCLKYMEGVPFFDIEEQQLPTQYVDIITSLPPCAGLSLANQSNGSGKKPSNPRGCSAPSNMHMFNAALYSVKHLKPKAVMVENAPGLFTRMGEEFAEKLNTLANDNGYTMSLVKTSSIRHGIPQERTRSFFFLWKGDKVPVLNVINKPYTPYHQYLRQGKFAKTPLVNYDTDLPPSADLIWQYVRTKFEGLEQHEILEKVAGERMTSVIDVIRVNGWFDDAIQTVREPKVNTFLRHAQMKFDTGSCIMDKTMKLAWDNSRSLMWKTLPYLLHPYEDRWLMTSEAFALMGFPSDFAEKVQMPTKDINIICQNVPLGTACDWMTEVAAALDGKRSWVDPETKDDGSYRILRQNNIARKNPMKPMWSL
jgi:site-specific DNA-cytosine methylase